MAKRGAPQSEFSASQIIGAFVRRGRRVALHPIAQDPDLLRSYIEMKYEVQLHRNGRTIWTKLLPEEHLFESFAARIRPLTVKNDDLYFAKVLDAIDDMTAAETADVKRRNARVRSMWDGAVERSANTRAYRVLVQDGGQSDLELAYAWLYQDSVHGDIRDQLSGIGIDDRYEAAVGVFSNIGLMICATLNHVNDLACAGHLTLPPGSIYDPVIVSDPLVRVQVEVSSAPEGSPLPETLEEDLNSAYDVVDFDYLERAIRERLTE